MYIPNWTTEGLLQRLVTGYAALGGRVTDQSGVTAPVASVTLVRTISFSIYQKSKYTYAAWIERNFGIDPLLHANTTGNYPNAATIACFAAAGATAGSLITTVACKISALLRLSRRFIFLPRFWPRAMSKSWNPVLYTSLINAFAGPFELTKLSAQVSVLMADRSPTSLSEPDNNQKIARSYQHKGTWKTARNIIKHRGVSGLYSGFGLHLCKYSSPMKWAIAYYN